MVARAARRGRRGVQLRSHQHAERLNDEELLLARRVGRLEDAQENVGEEDADLRLEMVLEEAHDEQAIVSEIVSAPEALFQ